MSSLTSPHTTILHLRDKEMVRRRTGGRSWSWWAWMIVCFSWPSALLWFLSNIYLCIPLAITEWVNPFYPVWFYVGLYKHMVLYTGSSMINAFIYMLFILGWCVNFYSVQIWLWNCAGPERQCSYVNDISVLGVGTVLSVPVEKRS